MRRRVLAVVPVRVEAVTASMRWPSDEAERGELMRVRSALASWPRSPWIILCSQNEHKLSPPDTIDEGRYSPICRHLALSPFRNLLKVSHSHASLRVPRLALGGAVVHVFP